MRPPVDVGVHRAPRCEPVVSLVRSRRAPQVASPVPLIVLPKSCSCRWGPCPPPLSLVWVCFLSFNPAPTSSVEVQVSDTRVDLSNDMTWRQMIGVGVRRVVLARGGRKRVPHRVAVPCLMNITRGKGSYCLAAACCCRNAAMAGCDVAL